MKKSGIIGIFLLVFVSWLPAQNNLPGSDLLQKVISQNYKLALQYKNGNGVPIDYGKAYSYFKTAAELGDPQSNYAIAYMHYKGLGCQQDYAKAAKLFAQGAKQGRDNSMYFYGLCWRNGYGMVKNEDSAKFYLKLAADLGYKQAVMELQMKSSENSKDSLARVLLNQINNAAIPDKKALNAYFKVRPHIASAELISGDFSGWLIQYDWSGTHIVATKKLQINLSLSQNKITGKWIEDESDTAKIAATISGDSLMFNNTKYGRMDHYSAGTFIKYDFQNAKLNLIQKGDSAFLAGTIEMFSPQRGEPSKPLFVALSRKAPIAETNTNRLKLTAYPNPSHNLLNAEFDLPLKSKVIIQLYSMEGKILYNNASGLLEAGKYSLPITVQNIPAATYILKIVCGNASQSIKVVKY